MKNCEFCGAPPATANAYYCDTKWLGTKYKQSTLCRVRMLQARVFELEKTLKMYEKSFESIQGNDLVAICEDWTVKYCIRCKEDIYEHDNHEIALPELAEAICNQIGYYDDSHYNQ